MIRIVADSNVYVSALLFGGNPGRVIDLAATGSIELCISDPIQLEVDHVLRDKFQWSSGRLAGLTEYLWSPTHRVEPRHAVSDCRDPDDNRVLECALEAQGQFIVTGDRDLLELDPYQNIRILTPRQFLDGRFWEMTGQPRSG